jgi:hypothetical protein
MTEVAPEQQSISLDGETYIIDDLSEKSKYFVSQLQDINQQIHKTKFDLNRLEVANNGFMTLLREEIAKEEGAE